jgi:Domain of unknown function (DUF3597)
MGLFNNIMSKIFGHAEASGPKTVSSVGGPDVAGSVGTQTIEQVDVAVILNGLAAKNPERLDWKGSIVDLMKLVGMDSSLSARKQLATELHYSGDQSDTAAMNVWLHKEVLRKLSENGGRVPQELLS